MITILNIFIIFASVIQKGLIITNKTNNYGKEH